MKKIMQLLGSNQKISGWKINADSKESYELFFVKGKLETVRCTDTCDKLVTVYVDHGDCKGDAQFVVYPSTTEAQLEKHLQEAVEKALLIGNPGYDLPGKETGSYTVESNFTQFAPGELAEKIAMCVFAANTVERASLNSVEVFVNKRTERVVNSRGLDKTQVRYDAMVEAIPTYNGETQSVELYEQYNFSSLDTDALTREIAEKMAEVKARYEALVPTEEIRCPVVLNPLELEQLFYNIAGDLHYASVYSHSNLWSKGDAIQKEPTGDPITVTMCGQISGSIRSRSFDSDGLALGNVCLVDHGKAVNYYGSNRYGQYLGEKPTGDLGCVCVAPGTAVMPQGEYLEVVSMSGLQVDFFNDYIGGEIRLAYWCRNGKMVPVTGISVSGSASEVLSSIGLTEKTTVHGSYFGPEKAILQGMKVF